jgi:hypothetical protein
VPVYKRVNKNFFKKWTPEMAYVLGFFAADGSMTKTSRGGCFLVFHSADKSLLVSILKVMNSNHKLSRRSLRSGRVYRFQIGSKEMFNDLLLLGFDTQKTKRIKVPKVPTRVVADFVRGYFDGDGNVWSGLMNKKRINPTKVLQVAFTSGCMSFLEDFLALLKSKGIHGGSIHKVKKGEYGRVAFSTLDALKLYQIMYNMPHGLCLKRKKLVFEKFIKMRV